MNGSVRYLLIFTSRHTITLPTVEACCCLNLSDWKLKLPSNCEVNPACNHQGAASRSVLDPANGIKRALSGRKANKTLISDNSTSELFTRLFLRNQKAFSQFHSNTTLLIYQYGDKLRPANANSQSLIFMRTKFTSCYFYVLILEMI